MTSLCKENFAKAMVQEINKTQPASIVNTFASQTFLCYLILQRTWTFRINRNRSQVIVLNLKPNFVAMAVPKNYVLTSMKHVCPIVTWNTIRTCLT